MTVCSFKENIPKYNFIGMILDKEILRIQEAH